MGSAGDDGELLRRYAELIVGFGANVQRGQIVAISTEPGKEALTRALAAAAYRAGASFVDVNSFDTYVKRARIEFSEEEFLEVVPSWYGERMLALGEQRCARIGLTGPAAPGLLDDLDPERTGRDRLPFIAEAVTVVNARTTNWTAASCPTPEWAQLVHPSLSAEDALARLWEQIAHVCRLDEEDPVAAWRSRMDRVGAAAAALDERRFEALHFAGPGTDLTVGLLAGSRWISARFSTIDGIEHFPNLPSEETFTAPDPERVDGVVRCTKPLVLQGSIVRDLRVRFEGGRAIELEASSGERTLRSLLSRDPGALRLGEVALVDGNGRVGALDTIFFDTLLDENAASHIAFGQGYEFSVEEADRERVNKSGLHVDVMIGGEDVNVSGVTSGGERVAVLEGGAWRV
ncbi:MAG: aminopeptidase [Solirubrobacteraceae bacterium]|nr:MAG: aminopeptidase [Solirubrobacterales bacterium]